MTTIKAHIGVVITIFVTLNLMVSAENPDYKKIKAEIELKSSKSLEYQRDILSKISKASEKLASEGELVLGQFKSHVGRLIPYLSNPTSEPFVDSIQEYVNSKTGERQHIIKIISDARIYQKRAQKEVEDSEKRYNKLLDHLSKNVEQEKTIKQARSQLRALGLAKDRMLEIKERMLNFDPLINEKTRSITLSNKKLDVYRLLLEMVKRAREIVSESKKVYIDSFSTKDKILDGSNRMDSLVRRAKLLMGECKRKGLYKVEMEKVNSLWDELNQIKEKIVTIAKNANKTLEHMYHTVTKAEGYENSIIEEGSTGEQKSSSGSINSVTKGVNSISKGFLRGRQIYTKLAGLQKNTAEYSKNMDEYKKLITDLLKKGNDLVGEMEGIAKRKSAMARKTLNLSTPQDLRSLIDLDDVDSEDSGSSSESETEDEIDKAKPKNISKTKTGNDLELDSDSSKRTKKMKSRKELDELRNKAIGSYLDDLELLEASSGSGSDGIDSSDSSYDSDSSASSGDRASSDSAKKDKKKKKGLIKRGFKFLKKIATSPESFADPVDVHDLDSSSDEFFDSRESIEDRQPDSDAGGDYSTGTRRPTPAPRTRIQHVGQSQPTNSQTRDSKPPSYKEVTFQDSDRTSYQSGSEATDLSPEEEEDYKRAVRESVISDLQKKAKEEMEADRRFNFADSSAKAQQDLFRLVRLSYELKEQFELVKNEFKSNFQFNATEILKNTLKDLLHQYLSSVCSVALDLTRPRYYQLFSSSGSGRIFGVEGVNKSRVVSSNTPGSYQSGNQGRNSGPLSMQGNSVINGRVGPIKTHTDANYESESAYHGLGKGRPAESSAQIPPTVTNPPVTTAATSPVSNTQSEANTTSVSASQPSQNVADERQTTMNTVPPPGRQAQQQVLTQKPVEVQLKQLEQTAAALQQPVGGGPRPKGASPINTGRRNYTKVMVGDRVMHRPKAYTKVARGREVRPASNMNLRPVSTIGQSVQPLQQTQYASQASPVPAPRNPQVQQAYTQTPPSPQHISGNEMLTRM